MAPSRRLSLCLCDTPAQVHHTPARLSEGICHWGRIPNGHGPRKKKTNVQQCSSCENCHCSIHYNIANLLHDERESRTYSGSHLLHGLDLEGRRGCICCGIGMFLDDESSAASDESSYLALTRTHHCTGQPTPPPDPSQATIAERLVVVLGTARDDEFSAASDEPS